MVADHLIKMSSLNELQDTTGVCVCEGAHTLERAMRRAIKTKNYLAPG